MAKLYRAWTDAVQIAFPPPPAKTKDTTTKPKNAKDPKDARPPKVDKFTFPYPPAELCACELPSCWLRKQEYALGACIHDIEALLRGAEEYSAAWLWKLSFKWHPDRFVRKFKESFSEEGGKAVTEMFRIVTELSLKEREWEQQEKEKEKLGMVV